MVTPRTSTRANVLNAQFWLVARTPEFQRRRGHRQSFGTNRACRENFSANILSLSVVLRNASRWRSEATPAHTLGRLENKNRQRQSKLQRMTTQQPAHLSSELASFLRGKKAKAKFWKGARATSPRHCARYATNLFTGRKIVCKNTTLNALPNGKSKA